MKGLTYLRKIKSPDGQRLIKRNTKPKPQIDTPTKIAPEPNTVPLSVADEHGDKLVYDVSRPDTSAQHGNTKEFLGELPEPVS